MSTSRIGPPGTPTALEDASATGPAHVSQAKADSARTAPADRLASHDAPRAMPARSEQATTAALSAPVEQPATERRARLGGDRGAWTARAREGILFAADNPEVGHALLAAFARGVA